ncbi:MAG: (Fe-S)-binding protein [Candidatus Lokiarchaeota archaeon]|nr:(Fe-S)-binding protein [Candidatus Lokiarchaeota archaeon]
MTLDDMRPELEKCVRCGQCRARCPSLDANNEARPGWDTTSPRGRMLLAQGLADGNIQPSKTVQDGIFTCFYCNQCVLACPSLANVTGVVIETRKHLVEHGCVAPQVLQVHKTIASTRNMFGLDQEDRVDLWSADASDLVEDHVGKPAPTLYFVGCQASYKGALASIPLRMVQVLDTLGEDFTLLGEDEACCGNPMELTGAPDDPIKQLAEANVKRIEELGVQRAIFTCPGCYRTFKVIYPRLLGRPLPFTCLMSSEYLIEKIQAGGIDLQPVELHGAVVYHDPCELGRHMGIYDEPRGVLKAIPGITLVEFKESKEKCNCCGMGGGVAMHDPTVADFQAKAKAGDIAQAGATIVATHCPACFQGIDKACIWLRESGKDVQVLDLIELVARALGIE